MSKRKRFVVTTIILGLVMGYLLVLPVEYLSRRYWIIGILAALNMGLAIWSLREGWKGIARVMTLILPLLFSLGAGLFTLLLPEVVLSFGLWSWGFETGIWMARGLRLLYWLVYLLAVYSTLLTVNIFSVSAIRTIALARAASAVGFLLTLVSGFLLYNAVWSFVLPFYWNALLIGVGSVPLLLQGLWSVELEEKLSWHMVAASLGLALVIGEAALVLSFWPVSVTVGSLAITTLLYVLLGLYQQVLVKRLFKNMVWEYVGVGLMVFAVVMVTTRWAA